MIILYNIIFIPKCLASSKALCKFKRKVFYSFSGLCDIHNDTLVSLTENIKIYFKFQDVTSI